VFGWVLYWKQLSSTTKQQHFIQLGIFNYDCTYFLIFIRSFLIKSKGSKCSLTAHNELHIFRWTIFQRVYSSCGFWTTTSRRRLKSSSTEKRSRGSGFSFLKPSMTQIHIILTRNYFKTSKNCTACNIKFIRYFVRNFVFRYDFSVTIKNLAGFP
jgi:hypothetical protein